jgi:hypothetical protein
MSQDAASEEKRAFWLQFIAARPPVVRFSNDSRAVFSEVDRSLDHIEYMMSCMEAHPLFPLEGCSFGSDLLDFRRGLAYEMVLRQLAHTRSLVANTNIRNRPGMGTALRCMLEMHAFSEYVLNGNRLEDAGLLEKLYHGRALTPGGWYDIEKEWEGQKGQPLPNDAKETIRALINLPRVGDIRRPVHDADKGAAYLYALYSEFVHPAFSGPREESEAALGAGEVFSFGTSGYYQALLDGNEPVELLGGDIKTCSFCLQLFWSRLLQIDPLFDGRHKTSVRKKLEEQGAVAINGRREKKFD